MLFGHSMCFVDLASVIQRIEGGYDFNGQLPGYLRDLEATHGRLWGVALSDWEGNPELLKGALRDLSGLREFDILVLDIADPLPGWWGVQRRFDLDLRRCVLYLGKDSTRLETIAREVGIISTQVFDPRYV